MKRFLWAALIFILAVGFLTVFKRRPSRVELRAPSDAFMLSYPLRHGGWQVIQRAEAAIPAAPEERVWRLVQELTEADSDPSVFPPLPETFPLRSVFVDGKLLYIDVSPIALEKLSGGSMEEGILLEGLRRTFASNLPEIDRFQILVDGVPRRTLSPSGEDGGHINVLTPIFLHR